MEKAKILNSNVWKYQNVEYRCLGIADIYNSNVSKKPKFRIPMFGKNSKFGFLMFGKRRNLEVQCLEKVKFKIPMTGKSRNLEFQCLEKLNF